MTWVTRRINQTSRAACAKTTVGGDAKNPPTSTLPLTAEAVPAPAIQLDALATESLTWLLVMLDRGAGIVSAEEMLQRRAVVRRLAQRLWTVSGSSTGDSPGTRE